MKPDTNEKQYSITRSRFFYGYVIVAMAFCIHLISYGISDSYGVLVNPLVNDFGWSRTTISGAYSLAFIVSGVLGIFMGIITDRWGPRIALSICAFCLGAGYLLMSQMHEQWQLYVYYGLIFGIGMSGIWAPILSLISRWFISRRGLVTGIVISGGGLGAFIGPPVITYLINTYHWNQVTLILGSFILVTVLLAAQFLRRDPSRVGQKPFGESKNPEQDLKAATQDFSLKQAIRTPQFWIIFAMLFCLAFYTFSTLVHVMPHAIQLTIPDYTAAYILASISGMSIIGNFTMGPVCDKIGPRKVFIISFALMSAALFWLTQASEIWALFLFSIVFGFNHGGNATAQGPILARIFGLKSHGTIFGVAAFGFTVGGALGPLVAGYIFDQTGGYQLAFLICGFVGILGLILTLVLRPTQRILNRI